MSHSDNNKCFRLFYVKQTMALLFLILGTCFLLLACTNHAFIESGPMISDDFIMYNTKSGTELNPSEAEDGYVLLFSVLKDDRQWQTARGIVAGDSLSKLEKRYGKLVPNYESLEYGTYLDGMTISEFYNDYKDYKNKKITIAFYDDYCGKIAFDVRDGKIEYISLRTAQSVKLLDDEARKMVDELIANIT